MSRPTPGVGRAAPTPTAPSTEPPTDGPSPLPPPTPVPPPRQARYWRIAQLLRFGVVGVLGTAVNVGIVHILHTRLGWAFPQSSAIATELAIVHNYVWNELWTFHIRQLNLGRFVRYQTSALVALVVTVGVAIPVERFVDAELAQLVGILCGAGINYVVNVRWTWGPAARVRRATE